MKMSLEAIERRREYQRNYRERNRESILAYQRDYYKKHPEKRKEYNNRYWEKQAAQN